MKKALSIFLTVLMLGNSTGIAYAQHFCSGFEMLSEITLGEKQLSCGMEAPMPSCGDDTIAIADHGCCKNHITQIKTDDNFAKASFKINLNKVFVATFVSIFVLQQVEWTSQENKYFAEYDPPPIPKDIPVLYQSFLI